MQCGADAHFKDHLTHLSLTTNAYLEIIKKIKDIAEKQNISLILLGGGGYNIEAVARIWTIIFSEISKIKLKNKIPQPYLDFCKKINVKSEKTLFDGEKNQRNFLYKRKKY